ncbi:GntR family transcriptional regulator [Nesterenkonia sp. MY13]|uniref:GntR family transcriptional regulator n=1 Tax=Nesterenkonia sedimenti TaxID=1463632 RepID=A0A7X8TH21_9MICC|nr:GntR family transcriptional regulator [Nesterenkonia sedimenti]NLS08585.1 GntR family transcriptional regulator [Nesterenkonia sedimenti]
MGTFAFAEIAQALVEEIQAGKYPPGSSLPSERELSERFRVSPGTVRMALRELVADGTVDGSRGRPKRVVRIPRRQAPFDEFRSFAQWARRQGHEPGGDVVRAEWRIADAQDELMLGVQRGRRVFRVQRVRTLDGEKVMLEHTHYPEWLGEIVETIDDDAPSVTALLADEHNIHFTHAEHAFGAERARAADADLLGITRSSALLVHRRVSRDSTGRALEWSSDRYIAGKIMLSVGNSWHSNPLQWITPEAFGGE